jgi:hypothetical protein
VLHSEHLPVVSEPHSRHLKLRPKLSMKLYDLTEAGILASSSSNSSSVRLVSASVLSSIPLVAVLIGTVTTTRGRVIKDFNEVNIRLVGTLIYPFDPCKKQPRLSSCRKNMYFGLRVPRSYFFESLA